MASYRVDRGRNASEQLLILISKVLYIAPLQVLPSKTQIIVNNFPVAAEPQGMVIVADVPLLPSERPGGALWRIYTSDACPLPISLRHSCRVAWMVTNVFQDGVGNTAMRTSRIWKEEQASWAKIAQTTVAKSSLMQLRRSRLATAE